MNILDLIGDDLANEEESMDTPEDVEKFLEATKALCEAVFPDQPEVWPELTQDLLKVSTALVEKEEMKKRVLEEHILSLQTPVNERPL